MDINAIAKAALDRIRPQFDEALRAELEAAAATEDVLGGMDVEYEIRISGRARIEPGATSANLPRAILVQR